MATGLKVWRRSGTAGGLMVEGSLMRARPFPGRQVSYARSEPVDVLLGVVDQVPPHGAALVTDGPRALPPSAARCEADQRECEQARGEHRQRRGERDGRWRGVVTDHLKGCG